MKYILSHTAAIVWYMRHESPRARGDRTSRASVTGSSVPNAALCCASSVVPGFRGCSARRIGRRPALLPLHQELARSSLHAGAAEGSLIAITSPWSDIPLYRRVPRACIFASVHRSELPTAVYAGMALCSDYRIDLNADGGVVQRARTDRRPATLCEHRSVSRPCQGIDGG